MEKLFFVLSVVFILFQTLFTCLPLGNDRLSFKRLPLITGIIIILNIIAFVATTPFVEAQDMQLARARDALMETLDKNPAVLEFSEVRKRFQDIGWVQDNKINTEKGSYDLTKYVEITPAQSAADPHLKALKDKFLGELAVYEKAVHDHPYYQLGLAPNGEWKFPQLITHMFMHGGIMHIVGNMIFFFAFGGALEERWGRGVFALFYLFIGFCACLPYLVKPDHVPLIGASGAISGVMGAFAASMSKTKIKVGWLSIPLAIIFLIMRKKPFGIIRIPAYIVLGLYFIADYSSLIASRLEKGAGSGVAYFAHVSGFFFGVFVALLWESFNPIKKRRELRAYAMQAVVTNDDGETTVTSAVMQAHDMLNRGEVLKAQYKLKYYLVANPQDLEAIKLMARACKALSDNESLNIYAPRLINQYLTLGDKAAALLVYTDLVGELYRYNLYPQLSAANWMAICDYLRSTGRNREAAAEYERLANAHLDNPLAVRACVQGGEAALSIFDRAGALKLFSRALGMSPPEVYEIRARRGIEMCEHILVSQSGK
jgi:membrane associated rhomboid family serine protease